MANETVGRERLGHVPKFHRIGAGGNQLLAVGGKARFLHRASMALEEGEFALSGDVPEPDCAVTASAHQQIAVWRKVEGPNPFRMTGKDGAAAEEIDRKVLSYDPYRP